MAVDNVFATTCATRDAMIRRAAKLAGLVDGGSALSADIQADGVGLIPDLIGMWHNESINLNTDHESIFPMPAYATVNSTIYDPAGVRSYVCILNHVAGVTNRVTMPSGNSYVCTAGHVADATVLTGNEPEVSVNWRNYWAASSVGGPAWVVGTAYAVSANDNQPGVGADWRIYWRPGGDIYTGGAIAAWLTGTAYLAPNQFAMPAGLMFVKYAFARDTDETTQFDVPVATVGEVEFQSIANKFTTGRPVSLWVRERPWESKSAFCWPGVPDSTSVLHVIGTYLMSDMAGASSDLDAPQTARLAFVYDLAALMADVYQRPQLGQVLALHAVALKRNFFRVYQESKSTVSQVAPRFARRRGRRH